MHSLLLLLGLTHSAFSLGVQSGQEPLSKHLTENIPDSASPNAAAHRNHVVPEHVVAALEKHADPVDALLALKPELEHELAQTRLLEIFGQSGPEWKTEGDKMRLRRQKKKFMDITNHSDFYNKSSIHAWEGGANLPNIINQELVRPLFTKVSTKSMQDALRKLTSFYNRMYTSPTGEESSQWLHNQVAQIIAEAPFHTHISLEVFTHSFGQTSTIARFEPKVRDFDAPLTIIGAHQDSANYLFPLLPAPGADDDGSGSVSILEAFKVLACSGYVPKDGPVEFHWYAAEEAGLLGSQDVAVYKKKQHAKIGAMLEFDATAFIGRNATETIGLIRTNADKPLTDWIAKLGKEYMSIPVKVYDLPPNAGSDYMSFTRLGYPGAFATEGNPLAGGFPGEYDPYMHTVKDTMDVDDETGHFSFEHMARFSELAIAFIVEQAGWDNQWR